MQLSSVATESIKIIDVAPNPSKPVENLDDPENEEVAPTKGRKRKAPVLKKGKEKDLLKEGPTKKCPFLASHFSKKAHLAKVFTPFYSFLSFLFLFFFPYSSLLSSNLVLGEFRAILHLLTLQKLQMIKNHRRPRYFNSSTSSLVTTFHSAIHGEEVDRGEEEHVEMRTTLGQKNPHEDDSVVSPAMDKDAVLVDDEEREVVDQPSKGLPSIPTIIISGSTYAETFDPHPTEGTLLRTEVNDDDDDADVDFSDLSAFD